MTDKYCWKCRRTQPSTAFGKDASRFDGLAAICTPCRRPPRQLPLIRRTQAEYERHRYATDAAYREDRRQRAHARKRGVAPLPGIAIEVLTERFSGRCAYCPAPARTWDHIVPVSQGGRTEPANIVPACVSCNSRKKDREVEEFIETEGVIITQALDDALAFAIAWGQL